MGERVSGRRKPVRKIVCRSDGSMFDVEQRRRISIAELRDHLVGGSNFEAETEETGRDCTFEVLRKVMGGGTLDPLSAPGGVPMPGLGALTASADLLGLARVVADRFDGGDREERRDDRTSSRRARPRGRPTDWAGEDAVADEGSA